MSRSALNAIYIKIGQEAGLTQIMQEFYRRMSQDILIGFFFDNKDVSHIANQQKEFLKYAMGASKEYKGRAPSLAHLSLPPILSGHFDRRLLILRETLRDFGLSEKDIREWLNFENAFRSVIVK